MKHIEGSDVMKKKINKEIELAWSAGFYDGEGSTKRIFYHYKTKKGINRELTKRNRVKAWIYDEKN